MSPAGSEDVDDPYGLLLDCLEEPGQAKSRLPRIVGLFEADERVTRLCAAWGCCLLANEIDDEETIEYLVRRLSDRLDEEDVSLELTTTLDYISTRYADQVETILEEMDDEERERGELPLPRVGNFTRANYYSRDHSRDGVGRTQIAGSDATDDPRTAYANREREERERLAHERERNETRDRSAEDESSDREPESGTGAPMTQQRTAVTSIATQSQFDKLHILATRERDRYADIHEALVGAGGEEAAVALRLLHEPDTPTEKTAFRNRIDVVLDDWAHAAGHSHVVSILDWGVDPRPWVATEFTGDSLADIDGVPPAQRLTDAINLADAVSHLHYNGVVHAGLDPGNVIYPDDIVESDETRPPFLDNVGLMGAFRFHFQPALMLDPRFAAPEYFDDGYGRIGPATDIYHLGAVLYYLFTGQAPYDGQFAAVREGVLGEEPPAPSTVAADVPPELDDVVSKAMATQKLTRYETVSHLEQELLSVRDRMDTNHG